MIEIRPVHARREKRAFLTFPWQIYKNDPLWVPPLLLERGKATDPERGLFFKNGYADFFIAYKDGRMAGTICCSHEHGGEAGECSLGFFECIDDYLVAETLFKHAERWAREHGLTSLCGTYNLDREDTSAVTTRPTMGDSSTASASTSATMTGWPMPSILTCRTQEFNACFDWPKVCASAKTLSSAVRT
jgi:hypothetical protein